MKRKFKQWWTNSTDSYQQNKHTPLTSNNWIQNRHMRLEIKVLTKNVSKIKYSSTCKCHILFKKAIMNMYVTLRAIILHLVSIIFQLDFETVQTVWLFLVFFFYFIQMFTYLILTSHEGHLVKPFWFNYRYINILYPSTGA
jgi:hypothetical protein